MTRQPPPRRSRTNFSHVQTLDMVRKRLIADYGTGMPWKAVGAVYGLSAGVALRLACEGVYPGKRGERARLWRMMGLTRPRRRILPPGPLWAALERLAVGPIDRRGYNSGA